MTRGTAYDLIGYACVAVAVAAIAAIVFAGPPLVLIWCLNTLFPSLAIPVNSYTMVAAFLMILLVRGRTKGESHE